MRDADISILEKEINGCSVTLSFAAMPVEGVIEKIQSILSYAYDERVQNDLVEIITPKRQIMRMMLYVYFLAGANFGFAHLRLNVFFPIIICNGGHPPMHLENFI